MTYYTIYKITNKINNKYYIGKHKTANLDDGYMGSGKLLKRAIQKYGIENFTKEILFIFDNEQEMNNKEKELVVVSEETYNLCSGGHGGFDYINTSGLRNELLGQERAQEIIRRKYNVKHISQLEQTKKASRDNLKKALIQYKKLCSEGKLKINFFLGKTHTDESKIKMSLNRRNKGVGIKNSQYGTCWITNGLENKKIKKEELDNWIELGYSKGRVQR